MMENSTYPLHAFPLTVDTSVSEQVSSPGNYSIFIGDCYDLCAELAQNGMYTEKLQTGPEALKWLKEKHFRNTVAPDLIVINTKIEGLRPFDFVKSLASIQFLRNVPVIFISGEFSAEERDLAIRVGASDYFTAEINPEDFLQRMSFLTRLKELNESTEEDEVHSVTGTEEFKIWGMKRVFDIVLASLLIVLLSPLMLLIAIAIKLDSRGPVLYVSKRAGKGYHIFDFYKFRTMNAGAEAEMEKLKHLNIYNNPEYDDQESLFFKAKNDPRTTRLGSFLRLTSLDEFPQLFNVLKGDMSIVGNRPLPLYEAEKLTQDQWALRFAAPAGITGLWQIRKSEQMSEKDRISLDITYARDNSFLSDLKIILKTPLVLFQKEEKFA